MDRELLNSIGKIDHSVNNTVFIVNKEGKLLFSQTWPEHVGKSVYENRSNTTLDTFHQTMELLKHQESTFLAYSGINPKSKQEETKYTYVRTIENSKWIIGSTFNESSIKELVAKQTIVIYEVYYSKFKFLIFFSLFFMIGGLIISYVLSQFLKNNFLKYQKRIYKTTEDLKKLNEGLEDKVQERTKELEEMAEELKVLATTDSLTKVNNRYAIMNTMETEISRAKRYNEPLSVLLFDVDHFKNINDNYGHDIGDVVLYQLAQAVKESLRDIDIIGRYGGEEFLVLMPNTVIENAKNSAERIRMTIEKHCFQTVGTVTISLGLAQWQEGEDVNTLFKRLDKLMYRSKETGRNRLYTDLN